MCLRMLSNITNVKIVLSYKYALTFSKPSEALLSYSSVMHAKNNSETTQNLFEDIKTLTEITP